MKKEGTHPQWRRSPAELNEPVVKVDDMNKVKKKLFEKVRGWEPKAACLAAAVVALSSFLYTLTAREKWPL